jgi:DNA adenine methylase
MTTKPAHPFLKWAGGKTQLAGRLFKMLPRQIDTYYEPFVGGGAIFFALAQEGRFRHAVLNDTNQELMDAFRSVRDFPDELVEQLTRLPFSKETFQALREIMPMDLSPVRRTARMIYLNRTCFNGLFRVNKAGKFNAPWGKYKNPKIINADNLRACGELLNRVASLYCQDFSTVLDAAQPGDAVYLDPPYLPLSETSNFRSYTVDGFTIDDHHRLAICFKELAARDVAVIASNSDTELTRKLYEGFEQHEVKARRNINSKGNKRGPISELIIVGRSGGFIPAEPDT